MTLGHENPVDAAPAAPFVPGANPAFHGDALAAVLAKAWPTPSDTRSVAPVDLAVAGPDPFASPAWYETLRAHCFADRDVRWIEGVGEPASVRLPVVLTARSCGEGLANFYSFRLSPDWSGQADAASRTDAAAAWLRAARACVTRLSLAPMRGGLDGALPFLDAARRAGWSVAPTHATVSHWLDLASPASPLTFAHYWAARPGSLRSTVRRRRASGAVAVAIETSFAASAWDEFETVYRDSWKPTEASAAFIRALGMNAAERGALRLGIARRVADGKAVAAQLWTVEGGVASIHKLAYREEARALSAGTLVTHALMERVIEVDRVRAVDFGTGDDAYKRDWMNRRDPLWRLDLFNRADPRAWAPLARTRAAALARNWKR